jgi:predicted transcriptional regulator
MNVLLSVRPEYANKIFSGGKKYEFRKTYFNKDVDKIYIYCTAPMQKILGVIFFEKIIYDSPIRLWQKCNGFSGMTKNEFFNYFKGRKKGFAIVIKKAVAFDKPIDPKSKLSNFTPPQSFYYFDDSTLLPRKYVSMDYKPSGA